MRRGICRYGLVLIGYSGVCVRFDKGDALYVVFTMGDVLESRDPESGDLLRNCASLNRDRVQ